MSNEPNIREPGSHADRSGPPTDPVAIEEASADDAPIAAWKLVAAVAGAFLVLALVAAIALAVTGGDADPEPQASGSVIVDGFDRADADTLGSTESGALWEQIKGTWGIRDRQARVLEPNAEGPRSYAVVDLGSASGSVSARAATMEQGWGLVFRYQGPHNYWFIMAAPDYAAYTVQKLVDDDITSVGRIDLAPTKDGTTVKVSFRGSLVEVFIDGKLRGSFVDEELSGATRVGLMAVGERGSAAAWDEFVASAEEAGTAPVVVQPGTPQSTSGSSPSTTSGASTTTTAGTSTSAPDGGDG